MGVYRGRAPGAMEGLRARVRALFWDVLEEVNPGIALVSSMVPGYTFCAEAISPQATRPLLACRSGTRSIRQQWGSCGSLHVI